jgi:putative chitinase
MKFNRKKFYDGIRSVTGISPTGDGSLTQRQVDGLNTLLDSIEQSNCFETVAQAAYFLATVAWECKIPLTIQNHGKLWVSVFQPVEEIGSDAYFSKYDFRKDLGNVYAGDGARFHGRGYVQNTGRGNALKTGTALAGLRIFQVDVLNDVKLMEAYRRLTSNKEFITIDQSTFTVSPELLLIPRISFLDAVDGMMTGRYTGKRLSEYINTKGNEDFINARRAINGTDHASDIAQIARGILSVLEDSSLDDAVLDQLVSSPVANTNPIKLPATVADIPPVVGGNSQPIPSEAPQPLASNVISTPLDEPIKVISSGQKLVMQILALLSTAGISVGSIFAGLSAKFLVCIFGGLAAILIVGWIIYEIVITKSKIEAASRPDRYTVK